MVILFPVNTAAFDFVSINSRLTPETFVNISFIVELILAYHQFYNIHLD